MLKRHYPRKVSIDFAEGGVETHLQIQFQALVEDLDLLTTSSLNPLCRWFLRTFIARPAYFRVIASYKGHITENGKLTPLEGECLYETVEFE